ncbi:hypothetical protein C8Q75DRAFT_794543 [Abortiporus biennis]|nr:hypothetical protein C8Q75DRAFT_794543 [Abortiporus biennis]
MDVVPPPTDKKPRTIVLCFDGTGDQFDSDNSNIVEFFSLLQKDDHTQQLVYYQSGIGTYTKPQIATPIMSKMSKLADEAVAWNLDAHVMDGYSFLMQSYQAGDKICIFGFSRGAYTARSLAGMIHKVGLLPANNHQQVPFAYKMYRDTTKQGWDQSAAFKKAFSIDVDVEFVGVWDTVASVGLISRRLPFVSSNNCIRYFRHALSLDERRAKFKANGWNRPTAEEKKLGVQPGEMPKSGSVSAGVPTKITDFFKKTSSKMKDISDHGSVQKEEEEQDSWEQRFSEQDNCTIAAETDVLEVWFAGCHADVGGGSVRNGERHTLARISLRWMIRQCFQAQTGIRFHASLLKKVGLDPLSLYPHILPRPPPLDQKPQQACSIEKERPISIYRSTSEKLKKSASIHTREVTVVSEKNDKLHALPMHSRNKSTASGKTMVDTVDPATPLSEEQEDLHDSLSPLYDQLKLKRFWWILEILPFKHRFQLDDDRWVEKRLINLGHGRKIPVPKEKPVLNFHRTVKTRIEAENLVGGRYKPKAKCDATINWVE